LENIDVQEKEKDKYTLQLDSKIILNDIAINVKKNLKNIPNSRNILELLRDIALVTNDDIVAYAISLYNNITSLYALYPDLDETYEEKMQVVLDEYNATIKLIPDDRIEEFVNATERKTSDSILEKYIAIQKELQDKMNEDEDYAFVMPKYYTFNVDYYDEQGTVYSQVIAFNRVIDPSKDIEILGVLKYLIDEKVINSLNEYSLLTVEINKDAISKIAKIYQEFMMQIDKPVISALHALNLGYQESFAIYKVKYSINLVFDENVKADTVEMAYSQYYCSLFEKYIDNTVTYSSNIDMNDIKNVLPSVSWSRYGQHGRLIPYRKEQLTFNRAVLITNSTFPQIISNTKLPPKDDILKSLDLQIEYITIWKGNNMQKIIEYFLDLIVKKYSVLLIEKSIKHLLNSKHSGINVNLATKMIDAVSESKLNNYRLDKMRNLIKWKNV